MVAVIADAEIAGGAGAGQHDELAAAVDQHDARGHGRLGDQRVGNPLTDGVELERAGQRCRQLLQAVELCELVLHALVEQAFSIASAMR